MSQDEDYGLTNVKQLIDTLDEFILEITLSKAAELARKGEYTTAENILKQFVNNKIKNPRVLDLLARIYSQKGRFSEAEILWKKALEMEPDNEAYLAGLMRISKMQRYTFLINVIPIVIITLIILLVFSASFTSKSQINNIYNSLSREITQIQNQISYINESLLNEIRQIKTSNNLESENNIKKNPLPRGEIKIQLDSTYIRTEDDKLILSFNEGLFSSGTNLKQDAKRLLDKLGEQLKSQESNISSIRIIGYTDDIPVSKGCLYRDNEHLGLARAFTVANYLSSKSRLPMSIFSLQSAGNSKTPYPNDTITNKLKNRTVVIYIYPLSYIKDESR